MNLNDPSRTIPQPIQREVRQRCGFGCVICGFPLYDYDHMKEWSKVKEHVAEDITLLCPEHHRQVTTGLLPRQKVIEANQNPFNLRQGHSSPMLLHYEGNSCEFLIAGNRFVMESQDHPVQTAPVIVDGIPLLSFILDNGHLLLSVNLFDENNNHVLAIKDNQLIYSTDPWDIQIVGNVLTIREKARKILVNMTFETPNRVIIDKARLLCNGVEILIKDDLLLIGNNRSSMVGCTFRNCQIGILIGKNPYPVGAGIYIENANRYIGSSKEIEKYAREILKELSNNAGDEEN